MIEAALFDMDGLLLDSERVYDAGVQDTAARLGYEITLEMRMASTGTNNAGTDACFSARNPQYDSKLFWQTLDDYIVRHGYDQAMPLKPGSVDILAHLTARGIRCALVTSTGRARTLRYLAAGGLTEYFSAIVTGDLGLPSKPAPAVYLRAAKLLGADITRCAVLEDSYNGLRAGRAAGAVTVMIPDLLPFNTEIAPCVDHVARDLAEAEAWLCR